MRNWKQKLPAFLLSAALLTLSVPTWPGGRDVPDRKSDSSSSSEEYVMPGDGETRCPEYQVVTIFSFGIISLDVIWMPEGSVRLQPSLVTSATWILHRVSGTGRRSCSAD